MATRPFGTLARWTRAAFGMERRDGLSNVQGPDIPERMRYKPGAPPVTPETALRQSAVWACLRLRADLVSTFPIDAYRDIPKEDGKGRFRVEVPKPPVLVEPGGKRWKINQWMYASQFDLDRCGNVVGIITETYGPQSNPLPARIDLQPTSAVQILQKRGDSVVRYRIDGKEYTEDKIWHEIQYPVSGSPVGLSPLAYAAWGLGESLSIDEFVRNWYAGGGIPRARLRNTKKTIPGEDAKKIKSRWRESVQDGDLFVHGMDWEYDLIQAEAMGMEWLHARQAKVPDICRYFGCPADLIDAAIAGQSITYANITQRNLQFLIMNLGPAVFRREVRLSDLLPRPRYVKLNTDSLVRMDPKLRAEMNKILIDARLRTPTEIREKDDLLPYTEDDYAEFERLYGVPRTNARANPVLATQDADAVALMDFVNPYSAIPYTVDGHNAVER